MTDDVFVRISFSIDVDSDIVCGGIRCFDCPFQLKHSSCSITGIYTLFAILLSTVSTNPYPVISISQDDIRID